MTDLEKEASELYRECQKLKAKIEAREAEFNDEMKSIRDKYRMKYTRLNQLAKQIKKGIHEL